MGILAEPAAMVQALKLPKGFSVCELGDQYVTHTQPHRLASEWYRELGCGRYESIDGNGRGTIVFDLNRKWIGKTGIFDLVTDFGTGEHVFNQAAVWRLLHDLAKPNGYIAFDRPAAGYREHCFVLINECLLEDLAAANHYEVVAIQRASTKRGELLRGVFRKTGDRKFVTPQQGRYVKSLVIAGGAR